MNLSAANKCSRYYQKDQTNDYLHSAVNDIQCLFFVNHSKGFPGVSEVKNLPGMKEMWVQSLGQEDLEKEMAAHSSSLAWENSMTDEPSGLQFMGSQRVGHDLVTKQQQTFLK